MKKALALLVAAAFGLGSITAFAQAPKSDEKTESKAQKKREAKATEEKNESKAEKKRERKAAKAKAKAKAKDAAPK
jgi:uncharacterized protein HemX